MVKVPPVPCTKEEMNSLIQASVDNDFCYMLFQVAKKTGRRLGEYYDVQVKDIDFERKVMMTKVLKRRQRVLKEAVLDDDLIYLMQRYIQRNALTLEDYIFRKYSYRHIQNRVTHYATKACIPHKVSFHNFRHYFITELFKLGWSYDKISKLTGHSSVGTLATYDHSVASDLKDDALSAIGKL